jgi:GABA(A) receptor-associated protein
VPLIDKQKFLVPADLTIAQFAFVIRRRLSVTSDQALFLFVNGTLPPSSLLLRECYEQHKDRDGFLYVLYSSETTFGGGDAGPPPTS